MYDLPSYVWALVRTGVIGIPATTCVMMIRATPLALCVCTTVAAKAAVIFLVGDGARRAQRVGAGSQR